MYFHAYRFLFYSEFVVTVLLDYLRLYFDYDDENKVKQWGGWNVYCNEKIGYLSNREEEKQMWQKSYRNKLSQALVNAVNQFFKETP